MNKAGKAVGPSLDNVVNGSYEPLSRPIFIYVSREAAQEAGGAASSSSTT